MPIASWGDTIGAIQRRQVYDAQVNGAAQTANPAIAPAVVAQTKGVWVFDDNSSIVAAGPALSHLIPMQDGSFLFLVSCGQIITGGTGRYAGAYGLKTSLGSKVTSGSCSSGLGRCRSRTMKFCNDEPARLSSACRISLKLRV